MITANKNHGPREVWTEEKKNEELGILKWLSEKEDVGKYFMLDSKGLRKQYYKEVQGNG